MDREEVYKLLTAKVTPIVEKSITDEEKADLDGVLWGLSECLADNMAGTAAAGK